VRGKAGPIRNVCAACIHDAAAGEKVAAIIQQSAKCLSLSQETNDSHGNFLYLLMAQAWIALAGQVERKDLQQKEGPYRSLEAELSEMLRKRVA